VRNVEDVTVTAVERSSKGFELRLSSNETLDVRKVIMATGLEYTAYFPPELANLPRELRSHSSGHHDFSHFKGRDVTVIGGGQSALETAALLREEGASVRLLVREPSLVWNPNSDMSARSIYKRLRNPRTGLREGLSYWMYCNMPRLFHHLPHRRVP
jgi:cation diffusion facilitator CzcD-associated flavoprotein CzcO